jgi:hypothetical protein
MILAALFAGERIFAVSDHTEEVQTGEFNLYIRIGPTTAPVPEDLAGMLREVADQIEHGEMGHTRYDSDTPENIVMNWDIHIDDVCEECGKIHE